MSTLNEIDRDIKSLSAQIELNNRSITQLQKANDMLRGTVELLRWKRKEIVGGHL